MYCEVQVNVVMTGLSLQMNRGVQVWLVFRRRGGYRLNYQSILLFLKYVL